MSLVSIRLPDDVEARLAEESKRAQRPKSEIARDAIIEYLERTARERFLADIARAARSSEGEDGVTSAEEALPLDNEALEIAEGRTIAEPKVKHWAQQKKKKKKR